MINMNFQKAILASILGLFLSVPTLLNAEEIDLENGKEIATGGCAGCHGVEGISPVPNQPHLAGQIAEYTKAQLLAFQSGERANAIMQGFASELDEEDMADVAAYYATLKANQGAVSEDQAELAKEGEKIYKGGVAKGNIPSCMGCHGPTGQGIPNHFPHIAGQHAQYLETQLLAFKKGERKGYNQIMSTLSFNLSEQQIKALAVYMSGLN